MKWLGRTEVDHLHPHCRRTQLPIAGVRLVAVSATIPNVRDIAEWLGADPSAGGLHVFGEDHRPVPLVTHVRGYAMTKVGAARKTTVDTDTP